MSRLIHHLHPAHVGVHPRPVSDFGPLERDEESFVAHKLFGDGLVDSRANESAHECAVARSFLLGIEMNVVEAAPQERAVSVVWEAAIVVWRRSEALDA